MLKVTVELLPFGREAGRTVLVSGTISQARSGALADYGVELQNDVGGNLGVGTICQYPRFSTTVWDLVAKAIAVGLGGAEELPPRPRPLDITAHEAGGVEYVRIWELPEPAQTIFRYRLARTTQPVIDSELDPDDCAYASDWQRFLGEPPLAQKAAAIPGGSSMDHEDDAMPNHTIPSDFPREAPLGSVPGAQPKLLVRLVNGKYIAGLTDTELLERYEGCEDLAQQCATYCTRKVADNPALTRELCLANVRKGFSLKVQAGEWDFSAAEQDWVMMRARQILGW